MSTKTASLILFIFGITALTGCMTRTLVNAEYQTSAERDFGALLERADMYRERGRYLEALSFYRDIRMNAGTLPIAVSAHRALGELYYHYIGDTGQALHHLHHALAASTTPEDRSCLQKIIDRIKSNSELKAPQGKSVSSFASVRHPRLPYIDRSRCVRTHGGTPVRTNIRVLLQAGTRPVDLSCPAGLNVFTPEGIALYKNRSALSFGITPESDCILVNGKPIQYPEVIVRPAGSHTLHLNNQPYRGFIRFYRSGNRLLTVNWLPVDEYLYGVLPREVSASWPDTALQAQAIAARTYAIYHMCMRSKQIYDVFSTTSSQVYGGMSTEQQATTHAVQATAGAILIHNRQIPLTLYHANSGGCTEALEGVWGGTLPYLSSVADDFSRARPGFSWSAGMTERDILNRLEDFGIYGSRLTGIQPDVRSDTGRIQKISLGIDGKTLHLSGNSFRLMVGAGTIKSTFFSVQETKGGYRFEGNGYGHGVGMSQWGAHAMAQNGHTPAAILEHYYPGTRIITINDSCSELNNTGSFSENRRFSSQTPVISETLSYYFLREEIPYETCTGNDPDRSIHGDCCLFGKKAAHRA